jgi:hypothetical protein
MGPDSYRLASPGDFNVEIAIEDLLTGDNQLMIEAIDEFGYSFSETISIYWHHGNIWPQVYTIDWSSTDNIQDVAQVVDGLWKLEESGIHPVVLDYDRLVAIGDMTWRDYEVTVPVTIHGIDPSGYSAPSYGPGVGILMRWNGHYDWGGWQPNIGWWPMGALGWYRWQGERLQIIGSKGGFMAEDTSGKKLNFGVRYLFKMRVESLPEGGSRYSLKVWPEGEVEPLSWDLMPINNSPADPGRGSFLLVAHHVDASFGNLSVTPLLPMNDGTPPEISNVKSVFGTTQATINWSTDEPATSWVSYGPTAGYEEGDAGNDVLTTLHAVTLSGLTPGAEYHYRVRSVDAAGNAATSGDLVFTTAVEGGGEARLSSRTISALRSWTQGYGPWWIRWGMPAWR